MVASTKVTKDAIIDLLQEETAATFPSDTSIFQVTGNATDLVHPQGKVDGTTTSGAYYYPTFEAFNKQVSYDDGIFATGEGLLTTKLAEIYQTMAYGQSTSDQNQENINANANNNAINTLYDNWQRSFGQTSGAYRLEGSDSFQTWVTTQGNTTASAAEQWAAIQSSLSWMINKAFENKDPSPSGSFPGALTRDWRDTSPDRVVKEIITKPSTKFSDIFNPEFLPNGMENPWNETLMQSYSSLAGAISLNGQNSLAAAQNTSDVQAAASSLRNWANDQSAKEAPMSQNKGSYATVQNSNRSDADNTYPEYMPYVTYETPQNVIANQITQGSGGSMQATVSSADASSGTVKISDGSSRSERVSSSGGFWFFHESSSASHT